MAFLRGGRPVNNRWRSFNDVMTIEIYTYVYISMVMTRIQVAGGVSDIKKIEEFKLLVLHSGFVKFWKFEKIALRLCNELTPFWRLGHVTRPGNLAGFVPDKNKSQQM